MASLVESVTIMAGAAGSGFMKVGREALVSSPVVLVVGDGRRCVSVTSAHNTLNSVLDLTMALAHSQDPLRESK